MREWRVAVVSVAGVAAALAVGLAISDRQAWKRPAPPESTFRAQPARAGASRVIYQGAVANAQLMHVAFAPDGKRLASVWNDYYVAPKGTVRITDASTGRTLRTLADEGSTLMSVAWSPDGRFVAATSYAGGVNLWDASSGRALRRFSFTGADRIVFSREGSRLVASSSSIYSPPVLACVWDIKTGAVVQRIGKREESRSGASSLALAPRGDVLATSSSDGVQFWDVTGGRLLRRFTSERADLLTFSPDGKYLADTLGDADPQRMRSVVVVWDMEKAQRASPLLPLAESGTSGLAWSPDGKYLIAGGAGGAMLWEWRAPRLLARGATAGPSAVNFAQSMAVSPQGDWIAFARGSVDVRRVDSLEPVDESESRRALAGAMPDPIPAPQEQAEVLAAPISPGDLHGRQAGDGLSAVAFTQDGRLLVGSGSTGHGGSVDVLFLWDTKAKRLLRRWMGEWRNIDHLHVSPGADLAVGWSAETSSAPNGNVWVRDLSSGEALGDIKAPGGLLSAVAFAPDGSLWTASSARNEHGLAQNRSVLSLWDARRGKAIRSWTVPDAAIIGIAPTRDGKNLIVNKAFSRFDAATKDYFTRSEIWRCDARNGQFVRRLFNGADGEPLIGMALSPDERQVAAVGLVQNPNPAAGSLASLRVFVDVASGRAMRREQKGYSRISLQVAYAKEGRYVVVRPMGYNSALEVWDAARGDLVKLTKLPKDASGTVTPSPDGGTLAILGRPLVRLRNFTDFLK